MSSEKHTTILKDELELHFIDLAKPSGLVHKKNMNFNFQIVKSLWKACKFRNNLNIKNKHLLYLIYNNTRHGGFMKVTCSLII